MTNMVLLQTVLEEVKNRNSATYSRIRGVIGQSEKHCYAFTNEHHRYAEQGARPVRIRPKAPNRVLNFMF